MKEKKGKVAVATPEYVCIKKEQELLKEIKWQHYSDL